jgi:hypothetical protein
MEKFTEDVSQTHHEFTDEPSKCPTCGYSFSSIHGKPEIWINPLYLKGLQESHKEEARKEIQAINQQKVLDGSISL